VLLHVFLVAVLKELAPLKPQPFLLVFGMLESSDSSILLRDVHLLVHLSDLPFGVAFNLGLRIYNGVVVLLLPGLSELLFDFLLLKSVELQIVAPPIDLFLLFTCIFLLFVPV